MTITNNHSETQESRSVGTHERSNEQESRSAGTHGIDNSGK